MPHHFRIFFSVYTERFPVIQWNSAGIGCGADRNGRRAVSTQYYSGSWKFRDRAIAGEGGHLGKEETPLSWGPVPTRSLDTPTHILKFHLEPIPEPPPF